MRWPTLIIVLALFSAPAAADTVFVGLHTPGIYSFDSETGAMLGSVPANSSWDMAIGPDGLLYSASSGRNAIERREPTTGARIDDLVTSSLGGLDGPYGMAFDPNAGHLFVSSYFSDQVLQYDASTGDFLGVAANVDRPAGLAFGPDGALYITSVVHGKVVRLDNGVMSDFASHSGFDEPWDIEFGPNGHLFASNFITDAPDTILEFNGQTGKFQRTVVSDTGEGPYALAFDSGGILYVGANNGLVRRYDPGTGQYLDTFADFGAIADQDHIRSLVIVPTVVPLPAAGWLALPLLGAMAISRRWRTSRDL